MNPYVPLFKYLYLNSADAITHLHNFTEKKCKEVDGSWQVVVDDECCLVLVEQKLWSVDRIYLSYRWICLSSGERVDSIDQFFTGEHYLPLIWETDDRQHHNCLVFENTEEDRVTFYCDGRFLGSLNLQRIYSCQYDYSFLVKALQCIPEIDLVADISRYSVTLSKSHFESWLEIAPMVANCFVDFLELDREPKSAQQFIAIQKELLDPKIAQITYEKLFNSRGHQRFEEHII